jgi:hypothetical protein
LAPTGARLGTVRMPLFAMAKDPIKKLSPLSPARLEEREWKQRSQEEKKTKAKAKSKRPDIKLK